MAVSPITYVENAITGGNAKSPTTLGLPSNVQIPGATSQAVTGLGDASNRLRGGVLGPALGVQNYNASAKMGG